MANTYVQMSEIYSLTETQVEWVQDFLEDCQSFDLVVEEGDDAANPGDIVLTNRLSAIFGETNEELENLVTEAVCQLSIMDDSLWVNGDETVNIDMVISILQAMLRETDDFRVLTGTWAETCSKPRAGEFGGGWFAVSAKEVKSGGTWSAAEQAAKEMANA